jgi:Lrp/AsnC family leucine-responsive transcriptional regulator
MFQAGVAGRMSSGVTASGQDAIRRSAQQAARSDAMDEIDRIILDTVQRDGRASLAEIGKRCGLSVSATNERVRKLEARGLITGWGARVDPAAVGADLLAFIFILLSGPEHEAAFKELVRRLDEVQECHHVTGEWSYMLKVRTRGTAGLERLLATALKSVPGLARTYSTIALSTVKETPYVAVPVPA